MTLTATKKKFSGELELTSDTRTAREVWTVISSTVNPSEAAVLSAPGLPQIGQSHASNYYLQVRAKRARQIAPTAYEVDVEYARPDPQEQQDNPQEDDPLNTPVDISYGSVFYQEPMDEDAKGAYVGTVNIEPFDPPIMAEHADIQVTFSKNFANFSAADMAKYHNTCNSAPWFGFPAYTCRVTGISGNEIRNAATGATMYHRVTVVVQIRNRKDPAGTVIGWKRRVIHQGFKVWTGVRNDGTPAITHALDANKQPVTEPVLLDQDGRRINEWDERDPVFLLFEPYHTTDFNNMNLGV